MKTKTHTATTAQPPTGRDQLILWILQDVKRIWDREGFGDDEAESGPLYDRLTAAIRVLEANRSDRKR